ncbi:MAG: hypothetical protein WC404_07565 [Candidatus Omnitrophota bacterium]|jgi:hypothetical protein
MLVDFGTVLKNLDGVELKDGDKTLTLGLICANALLIAGTEKEEGAVKAQKYDLALKVYKGGSVEVTTDEISKLKSEISKAYGPLVVGQAFRIFN